jgi:diguanylate cyclase (GGDEF)-like protein
MRASMRDLMLGTLLGATLPVGVVLYLLDRHNRELVRLSRRLEALSGTDPLTALPNRRALDERLAVEVARANRYAAPLALVMIDLDHFKRVNDRHGHGVGDAVLRRVAALLDAGKRAGDLVARLGGEELAALLPHTDARAAIAWAERMRITLATAEMRTSAGSFRLTASFGVAAARPGIETPMDLLDAADRALYAAKRGGRNRVEMAEGNLQGDAETQRH